MTHLLDSSAWLTHLFGEPGVDEVNLLFDTPHTRVSISVLSIPEVFIRLKSLGKQAHWPEIWRIYSELYSNVFSVDDAIAHQAVRLRDATPERLPTIDALIAATALVNHLTLVHRDPHMTVIQNPDLRQQLLPDK
jgi:predicted nucleic acid-binding protein